MKLLIVEDNIANKILLVKILQKQGYEVTHVNNGIEALELLKENEYDAVLTDWMMPKLDGIELIERIRRTVKNTPAILMITALASRKAKEKALLSGADDYIAKPYNINDLLERLKLSLDRKKSEKKAVEENNKKNINPDFAGVAIAASTGGPPALLKVISGLKLNQLASYFVVLHGPAWMLESFSQRLQQETKLIVKLGRDEMKIQAGEIYLCPGDRHMTINPKNFTIELLDTPPENFVKPSADPIFKSVAEVFGNKSIGVILTGMGHDGTIGAGYIAASGGLVIAQDPVTAIMPSMPQSIIDLRIAKLITPLNEIADLINKNVEKIYKDIILS